MVYVFLRVIFPLIDTVIIVLRELTTKGSFGKRLQQQVEGGFFARTDWTQLYFWSIAVMNAFNAYFFLVIRSRARLPAHLVAKYEQG